MACAQAIYSIAYFAPLDAACLQHYHNNATNTTPPCLSHWSDMGMIGTANKTSYIAYLVKPFVYPSPQQAWFCVYLFVYSQILAFSFSNWHPRFGANGPEAPSCCGSETCLVSKKPFSLFSKVICCMGVCCFLPATNSSEFLQANQRILMSPLKLALVPSICLTLIELSLRWAFPDGKYHAFSFLLDWCNNLHFLLIFFLGYAITAGDSGGFANILRKCRWWYFTIGTVLLVFYSFALGIESGEFGIPSFVGYILKCVLRGPGEWLFMVGIYAVTRNTFSSNWKILKVLREMAMPFYLLHQQILIVLASGTLWVPYLGSFVVNLLLSTLITGALTFIITKLPDPIRYFFGHPSKHWLIPGKTLNGFLPVIMLAIIIVLESIVANIITRVIFDPATTITLSEQ